MELAIGEAGEVYDCRVIGSSGHGILDEHTCQLLSSRARFRPTTDENGHPVAGTFLHSVRWQIITNANWATNGFVRAEMTIDPVEARMSPCTAEISGEISDYMNQMACFVLTNQAGNIVAALTPEPKEPFRAVFVLPVHPDAGDAGKERFDHAGERIAYASAAVMLSPQGNRTDCRMEATDGPAAMIFPICGPTPQFRYTSEAAGSGKNVVTTLRQEVAYYVEDME